MKTVCIMGLYPYANRNKKAGSADGKLPEAESGTEHLFSSSGDAVTRIYQALSIKKNI